LAVVSPAPRLATYEDVLAAPANMVAEIVDGGLVLSPRPAKPHAAATTALSEELGPPFKRGRGGPGGWLIIFEPELHFGNDVLVPDLAGWRRERMPALVADLAYFTLAPDWVCEVISPGTARVDRVHKRRIYGEEGVGYLWFVDPIERTLEVFCNRDRGWSLVSSHEDAEKVRAKPFDAIELDLSILWADVVFPERPSVGE
jgi:Uma2 family endonuclease